jgi:integrase/recombinase XerC
MKLKKLVSTTPKLLTYRENLNQNWCWEWFDEKGKRCKKYGTINREKTVEGRYAEAERLRVQMETGLNKKPKPTTSIVYQHLIPYLEKHVQPLRLSSRRCYTTILGVFEKWVKLNGYKLFHPKKITKIIAEDYARYLSADRALENATYNKHINTLDMLFDYLVREDVIARSPFEYIKRRTVQSVSVSAFKEKDVQKLRAVLKAKNMTVYISCMVDMYAFIRPNEIRNLRLKDFDFEANTITIDKEFAKNKKTQKVAILPALREILLEYIGDYTQQDFFLLSKKGKPGTVQISNKYVVENHNRILAEHGYNNQIFKPYSWKHTGNSLAYKNGASLRFLKSQNRHHSEAMTEIYLKSIVAEDLVTGQEQFFNF